MSRPVLGPHPAHLPPRRPENQHGLPTCLLSQSEQFLASRGAEVVEVSVLLAPRFDLDSQRHLPGPGGYKVGATERASSPYDRVAFSFQALLNLALYRMATVGHSANEQGYDHDDQQDDQKRPDHVGATFDRAIKAKAIGSSAAIRVSTSAVSRTT